MLNFQQNMTLAFFSRVIGTVLLTLSRILHIIIRGK